MNQTMIHLRDYQTEAVDAVQKAWASGMRRPAVVLSTGSGKTIIFSYLTSRFIADTGQRVLILVHRDELADQAIGKLRAVAPHLSIGKVKAEDNEVDADVVVASVQTVSRAGRLAALVRSQGRGGRSFGRIITDECHHSVAKSYLKVYDAFQDAVHLGVTATLARGDGVGLGSVWADVVYTKSALWMISKGYLTDVRGRTVELDRLDLSRVARSGGDYAASSLGKALAAAGGPALVAAAVREHAASRRSLVFLPDVATAYATAAALTALDLPCAVVEGKTPREERQLAYERFAEGEIRALVSCMVLTEGFDMPMADCAVIARPTRSAPLFIQMVGRVLRPWPGKTDALVINVAGAGGRISTLIDLDPGAVRSVRPAESLSEAALREAEEDARPVPARGSVLFDLKHRDVGLFASSGQNWLRTRGGVMFVPVGDAGVVMLWPARGSAGRWDVCRAPRSGNWIRLREDLDLSTAMAWAETEADEYAEFAVRKTASWRRSRPSEAQTILAARLGVGADDSMRKGDVSDAISVALASRQLDRYMPKKKG